jgi:hypothetical protein
MFKTAPFARRFASVSDPQVVLAAFDRAQQGCYDQMFASSSFDFVPVV